MNEPQSSNNQSPQEMLLGIALGYMLARAVHAAPKTLRHRQLLLTKVDPFAL